MLLQKGNGLVFALLQLKVQEAMKKKDKLAREQEEVRLY